MNGQTHPVSNPERSLTGILRDKNERLLAKNHKLETELRLIRKMCLKEYANDPHNTTLDCVRLTFLALNTSEEKPAMSVTPDAAGSPPSG